MYALVKKVVFGYNKNNNRNGDKFLLVDENKNVLTYNIDTLKKVVKAGELILLNFRLTSDYRLIRCDIDTSAIPIDVFISLCTDKSMCEANYIQRLLQEYSEDISDDEMDDDLFNESAYNCH